MAEIAHFSRVLTSTEINDIMDNGLTGATSPVTGIGHQTSYGTGSAASTSTRNFTRGISLDYPLDDTDLDTPYTESDYEKVEEFDGERVAVTGGGYLLHQFKKKHENDTDPINIALKCRASLAPSAAFVELEIFNRELDEWESLDSDNTAGANEDFDLAGVVSSDLENYYDQNNWVSLRIYQNI
jgi:hypothetical protein